MKCFSRSTHRAAANGCYLGTTQRHAKRGNAYHRHGVAKAQATLADKSTTASDSEDLKKLPDRFSRLESYW
ncbi:MAG: hypothetical protein ACREV3_01955 [Gammaproteobacteria bacterium]